MLKSVYNKSPKFLQNVFLTLQAYKYRRFRFGGKFKEYSTFLEKSQKFSESEISSWQLEQFKKLFGEAYTNTTYYKNIFDKHGIDPYNIKDFTFLNALPILTKEIITDNPEDFINSKRKIVYTARTGGTTGAPLITPFDADSVQLAFAFVNRFFEQSGVKYGSRNIHMTGQQVVPLSEKKSFWRTDYLGESLYLSIHHLGPNTFNAYWEKITSFRPNYIFGYTSFIYDLAFYINANFKSGELKLKGVFPSSEKLTPEMRNEIEMAFDCKVFDHYGSTEGIPMVTQCNEGNYHVVPESGIIEFLAPDGSPSPPGEPAEMYMTSLRQFSRPILRYKIGDTAVYSNKKCNCGLPWIVIEELTGRLSEWITLKDKRRISQFSHQIFKMVNSVKSSQIIQHDYDYFEVLIVKKESYDSKEELFISNRIKELVGTDIKVEFSYPSEIAKTSGGKRPSLISKVS